MYVVPYGIAIHYVWWPVSSVHISLYSSGIYFIFYMSIYFIFCSGRHSSTLNSRYRRRYNPKWSIYAHIYPNSLLVDLFIENNRPFQSFIDSFTACGHSAIDIFAPCWVWLSHGFARQISKGLSKQVHVCTRVHSSNWVRHFGIPLSPFGGWTLRRMSNWHTGSIPCIAMVTVWHSIVSVSAWTKGGGRLFWKGIEHCLGRIPIQPRARCFWLCLKAFCVLFFCHFCLCLFWTSKFGVMAVVSAADASNVKHWRCDHLLCWPSCVVGATGPQLLAWSITNNMDRVTSTLRLFPWFENRTDQ